MTWAKLSDTLHTHPKTDAAGLEALGLWAVCMSWSSYILTNGFVPTATLHRLANGARAGNHLAAKLVSAGFFHEASSPCPMGHAHCDLLRVSAPGWRFHDWSDYNPTKEEVEQDRARRSESGRRGGQKSGEVRAKQTGSTGFASASAENEPPIPSRTRPDPREEEKPPTGVQGGEGILTGSAEGKKTRAKKPPTAEHFMPEGWAPTPAHVAKARERNVDLDLELEKFLNWADNRKVLSWNGRFATWILNAHPRVGPPPPEARKVPQQQPPRLPLPGLDCPTPRSMGAPPVYTHNRPFEPITAEEQAEYEATAAEQDRRIAARRAAEAGAT
jgi:hypothetical protein